jgi:hypothetical protein
MVTTKIAERLDGGGVGQACPQVGAGRGFSLFQGTVALEDKQPQPFAVGKQAVKDEESLATVLQNNAVGILSELHERIKWEVKLPVPTARATGLGNHLKFDQNVISDERIIFVD